MTLLPNLHRFRFLLWLLPPLVAIILIATNAADYRHSQKLIKQTAKLQSTAVAEEIKTHIQTLLHERTNDLALLAYMRLKLPPQMRDSAFMDDALVLRSTNKSV